MFFYISRVIPSYLYTTYLFDPSGFAEFVELGGFAEFSECVGRDEATGCVEATGFAGSGLWSGSDEFHRLFSFGVQQVKPLYPVMEFPVKLTLARAWPRVVQFSLDDPSSFKYAADCRDGNSTLSAMVRIAIMPGRIVRFDKNEGTKTRTYRTSHPGRFLCRLFPVTES